MVGLSILVGNYHIMTGSTLVNLCHKLCKTRCFSSVGSDSYRSTIFSLCSGFGKSGIAVFRISGPSSVDVLTTMTQCKDESFDEKQMLLKRIYHPATKEQIDRGLVLWFPRPNSLTGEDVCELHVHGGPAIINQVSNALSLLPNFRQALPGEFMRRSFENGKVDLTQVEGLCDLINAENEIQRKQALRLLEGFTRSLYNQWTDKLIKGMAHIEAYIDFGEEERMEEGVFQTVASDMSTLLECISQHLRNEGLYEQIKDGMKVCIVGEPNVGKSSLLNCLCKRSAAIVSPHAGTTRDVIEVSFNLEGFPVVVSDTAGLRKNVTDEVENIGIERAHEQSTKSDMLILLIDSTKPDVEEFYSTGKIEAASVEAFIIKQLEKLGLELDPVRNILLVFNKIDLASPNVAKTLTNNKPVPEQLMKVNDLPDRASQLHETLKHVNRGSGISETVSLPTTQSHVLANPTVPSIHHSNMFKSKSARFSFAWCVSSCCSMNGLTLLEVSFKELVSNFFNSSGAGNHHSINSRHHQHLNKVCKSLSEFLGVISEPPPGCQGLDTRLELSAEKLRAALYQMGHITGRITTDQILTQIFKDFCIGK